MCFAVFMPSKLCDVIYIFLEIISNDMFPMATAF